MYDLVDYYNPAIGRFTSEDPIDFGGGNNFYNFVGGNPIKFTDKYGLVEGNDWRDQMHNGGGLSNISYKDWAYGWQAGRESSKFFNSFSNKAEDAWKSFAGYNWCCFANCIGKNKELFNALAQEILFNIMTTATVVYNPAFALVLNSNRYWKLTENVFNVTFLWGIIDEVGTCYKECLK